MHEMCIHCRLLEKLIPYIVRISRHLYFVDWPLKAFHCTMFAEWLLTGSHAFKYLHVITDKRKLSPSRKCHAIRCCLVRACMYIACLLIACFYSYMYFIATHSSTPPQASLDEPTQTVVIHHVSPNKMQCQALLLADKVRRVSI